MKLWVGGSEKYRGIYCIAKNIIDICIRNLSSQQIVCNKTQWPLTLLFMQVYFC